MSNFICSECGMTNIDCGGAGYKTPKEIELEKKLDIAVKALKHMAKFPAYYSDYTGPAAQKALKEIDLVGTSVSLAKEEV